MLFNFKDHDHLAFRFVIPHVSLLLIYKDNWNKSLIMRRVIAEIIRNNALKKIYIGLHNDITDNDFTDCKDCAFINMKMYGINLLDDFPETVEELFVRELKNVNNVLHFDNTKLNIEDNISSIDISIKICASRVRMLKSDSHAA